VVNIRRYIGGANVDIAIFPKEIRTPRRNGDVFTRTPHVVTVSKSYKDSEGAYQNSSVFNPHELLVLSDAIEEAYRICIEVQKRQPGEEDF